MSDFPEGLGLMKRAAISYDDSTVLKIYLLLFMLGATCISSGCALCHAPYDYTYAAYGGRWDVRCDRECGRVGSCSVQPQMVIEQQIPFYQTLPSEVPIESEFLDPPRPEIDDS